MLFCVFSRRGRSSREQHPARPAQSPGAPHARPQCAPPATAVGLADVRLGSLGLALSRQGNFAEWMRKDAA